MMPLTEPVYWGMGTVLLRMFPEKAVYWSKGKREKSGHSEHPMEKYSALPATMINQSYCAGSLNNVQANQHLNATMLPGTKFRMKIVSCKAILIKQADIISKEISPAPL